MNTINRTGKRILGVLLAIALLLPLAGPARAARLPGIAFYGFTYSTQKRYRWEEITTFPETGTLKLARNEREAIEFLWREKGKATRDIRLEVADFVNGHGGSMRPKVYTMFYFQNDDPNWGAPSEAPDALIPYDGDIITVAQNIYQKRKTMMAIYHCSIKIISRGKGQSAVAAAAYRAGEKITNEYDGITHDYTRKGGVVHTEILLPRHAPAGHEIRSVLWNAVEQVEKAKNSQLAREIELALPAELTLEQNISLVHEYVTRHFVSVGMCADVCVHDKNNGNPHAHIMLTMRPFEPDGSWGGKQRKEYILDRRGKKIYDPQKKQYKCRSVPSTDWNEQTKAEEWRAGWAEACNAFLEQQGYESVIDHRSYERQGIEQVPTVHMGVAAAQMERKGIATERGDRNREIVVTNKQLRQLRARINHLTDWLKEAAAPAAPPTLVGVLQSILSGDGQQDHHVRIPEKTAARVLGFLQENNISTLPALRRKVYEMQNELDDVRSSMKYIERRMRTLDEHIRQGEIFTKHCELYSQYQQLKPRKQAAFYEAHRADLMAFEAAKRYLDACLNGHALPLEAWKKERTKLAAERGEFSRDYAALKEQVLDVENVQWAVERIVREAKQPQKDKREKARELS